MSATELGRFDAVESDEDAQRGLRYLQQGFRRLDALERRGAQFAVQARSSLAGDRDATPYNPIPDQVHQLLAVASDHLRAVQFTVEETGGKVPAMALFTLVRSAYEAAGTAMWLLHPKRRDDRVLRSLQVTLENRRQVHTAGTELGDSDPGFERTKGRLDEIRLRREGLRDIAIGRITGVTERLRSIGVLVPDLVFEPLLLWRLASGIAHGNTAMLQQVLERHQVSGFEDGSAAFRVTTSVVTISVFYAAALDLVERLLELVDERNCALASDRGRTLIGPSSRGTVRRPGCGLVEKVE